MSLVLANEMSNDFEAVKTNSHMIKSETETSQEVLHNLISNMDIQTNLTSKISHYKKKNKAEIFSEKVVVANQKTKVSIYVEKIKNTKSTYNISYDIDLPNRPIFAILVLMVLGVSLIFAGIWGLAIAYIFYLMFSLSDAKQIQKIFPIKSIIHDAVLQLEKDNGGNKTSK